MKCNKIFALLLSLCMIASLFSAMPINAATENVVDIDLPLDDKSELTWVQSGVTLSNADGIGGRDDVVLASGLANSNNNTVGVKLPDGFAFAEGDVLTYSIDVYSATAINPDMWLRNHGNSLNPFAILYNSAITANTWTTVTGSKTFSELEALITDSNSSGTFTTSDNYAFYIRPRANADIYLDNLVLTVAREVAGDESDETVRGNIINITVEAAADITWLNGGAAADTDGIGGRDGVIALSNLANANGNTAGVKLTDGFAFQDGDILTYSYDVYSESITNPDIWLRNHGNSLSPFATFYNSGITTGEWTTVTKTLTFDEIEAAITTSGSSGTFETADNYALYFRPRQNGTLYIDNFTVTVSRVGYEEPDDDEPIIPDPEEPDDEVRGNIIDIDAPLDASNELTWIASEAVTVTEADAIGGRDDVLMVAGLADSNSNTAGLKLPDGFAFQSGDIITYSVDVYSDTAINPDIWLRNHGSALTPLTTFYNSAITTGTWTTLTKTVTFDELGTTYDWTTAGNYAIYIRPRTSATVYLDNFKVTVSRLGYEEPDDDIAPDIPEGLDTILDIDAPVDNASELTWMASDAVVASNANGIGGRDNVVKVEGLADANDKTAGVKLPDGFAFQQGDVVIFSVDVYSDTAINPNMWLRDHSDLAPFAQFSFDPIETGTWTTVEGTFTYDEIVEASIAGGSTGAFDTAGNYAFYLRPRQNATVYFDNIKFTVMGNARSEGSDTPEEPVPSTELEVKGYLDYGNPTVQQTSLNYTLEDGTFVVDFDEIVAYNNGQNLESNCFVRVIPETPVDLDNKFKLSFDVETAGLSGTSKLTVKARLFDNATGTVMANTIGFLQGEVKVNVEGGATVELTNISGLSSTGSSSLTAVASIGIGLDVQSIANADSSEEDAFIKIGNIKLEYISEITDYEVIGTTADSATFSITMKSAVVENSIKNGCVINGKACADDVVVVIDEADSKKATVTISGLTSSTEYKLVLDNTVTPATTIEFRTLDEASVEAGFDSETKTVSYTITSNKSETTDIYSVLLRCKGNTVIETKVNTHEECASGEQVSGNVTITELGEGEYIKFFVWTFDGNVNSLAPSRIFE